jgi:hypothetical protein
VISGKNVGKQAFLARLDQAAQRLTPAGSDEKLSELGEELWEQYGV